MTDAPERIWAKSDFGFEGIAGTWADESVGPYAVKYIRADLHAEAIEAAEKRGFVQGIEAAIEIANDAFPDYEGGCSLQDQAARDLRDQIVMDIRALSPTPSTPVTVQEAAKALYSSWLSGAMEDGADAAADDAITSQWAHVDRTYPDAGPVIEAWLRALAEQEGE